MRRVTAIITSLSLAAAIAGCNRRKSSSDSVETEKSVSYSYPGYVMFGIQNLPSADEEPNGARWFATYIAEGKVAKFQIEFDKPEHSDSADISFGKGRFARIPGSDSSVLIRDLQKALEATVLPTKVTRVATLPFEFAIIGERLSRDQEGGLNVKPEGEWMAVKLFFSGDEGEVFMNLAPNLGKAEFTIKDSDYGNFVVGELAKVL
jgi:hypothetical protein